MLKSILSYNYAFIQILNLGTFDYTIGTQIGTLILPFIESHAIKQKLLFLIPSGVMNLLILQ